MTQARAIYRNASGTDDSLTPRPGIDTWVEGGLSFYDSLDTLRPGKDTTRLRRLRAIYDRDPPGHVTVRPESQAELEEWASARGTGVQHPLTQELRAAITAAGYKRR